MNFQKIILIKFLCLAVAFPFFAQKKAVAFDHDGFEQAHSGLNKKHMRTGVRS